ERDRRQGPNFVLLVEQPPDEVVERQLRIGQLVRLHRPAEDRDMGPVGMVEPRVQPLPALLALGQMLQQKPAREPMLAALLRRQPYQARDLLRLRKIALR